MRRLACPSSSVLFTGEGRTSQIRLPFCAGENGVPPWDVRLKGEGFTMILEPA